MLSTSQTTLQQQLASQEMTISACHRPAAVGADATVSPARGTHPFSQVLKKQRRDLGKDRSLAEVQACYERSKPLGPGEV